MLDSIERIRRYTEGMDPAAFHEDQVVQDAVVRRTEVMGEAVSYLPDDLKARYSQIPWQDIKDMRNTRARTGVAPDTRRRVGRRYRPLAGSVPRFWSNPECRAHG
jgi:uncharacterized protein with HEPN domain